MSYTVRALKVGECALRGRYVFQDREPERLFTLYLYVWLIEGGPTPMIVDTGPEDLASLNQQVASLLERPVIQAPEEETATALRAAGVNPTEVSHVFLTHMHYDHCSDLKLFPNAQVVVSGRGLQRALNPPPGKPTYLHAGFPEELARLEQERRLLAMDDQEVAPGVSVTWLGGHSPCSQGIVMDTRQGRAVIAGDVAFCYENVERDIPIGVYSSLDECRAALRRLREEFDVVLPGHDPAVLERFPGGAIG